MEKLGIFDILKDFIKDHMQATLSKLEDKMIDKVAAISAIILGMAFLIFTFALFFIFVSIGLAIWIGDYFDNLWLGFLLVSLWYLFFGTIFWVFRRTLIKRPIARMLKRSIKENGY
jgi:hypothetical protein